MYEVSKCILEILPFIEIDVRSVTYHFRGNMIEARISHDMESQLSPKCDQRDQIPNSLEIVQSITVIDGFYLQRIYTNFIDTNESHLQHLHIIFDEKLVCTYNENDKKFHARPIICGSPTIISMAGIVEGPAKPKSYYFKQMLKDLLSVNSKEIDNEFANRYVTLNDLRLVKILTGYVLQAIFFLQMVTHFVLITLVDYLTPIGKMS